jgi:hypothetical protein
MLIDLISRKQGSRRCEGGTQEQQADQHGIFPQACEATVLHMAEGSKDYAAETIAQMNVLRRKKSSTVNNFDSFHS